MLPGVKILLKAAVSMECGDAMRIRALVFYHHFWRFSSQKSVSCHNDAMVAAAALKCAARYEEEDYDYDAIAHVFYCLVNETDDVLDPTTAEFKALKKSLITIDLIMQRKLEFIFSHRLAHEFLVPFLCFILERNYHLSDFHEKVAECSLKFANDMYMDPMCLNYKPDHIAIACIHATLHVMGLLKDLHFIEPWFQAFSRDLTVSKLREIKVFLFRLYNDEGDDEPDANCDIVLNDNEETEKSVPAATPTEGNPADGALGNPTTVVGQGIPTEIAQGDPIAKVVQGTPIEGAQGNAITQVAQANTTVVAQGNTTEVAQVNTTEVAQGNSLTEVAQGNSSTEVAQGNRSTEVAQGNSSTEAAQRNSTSEVAQGNLTEGVQANTTETVRIKQEKQIEVDLAEKVQVKLEKDTNPTDAEQVEEKITTTCPGPEFLETQTSLMTRVEGEEKTTPVEEVQPNDDDDVILLEEVEVKKPDCKHGSKKRSRRKHQKSRKSR